MDGEHYTPKFTRYFYYKKQDMVNSFMAHLYGQVVDSDAKMILDGGHPK